MPLNATPPTTTVEGLRLKAQCARGKLAVDVGFWGGLVPDNLAELRPLWEAGVFGFKCFLVPSGVEEFPPVGEGELGAALPVLAGLGAPLLVHAEAPGPIEASLELQASLTWESRRYACYLATRPRVAEHQAIALLLRLADRWGGRIHIVHLSAADAAPMLAAARAAGLAVTVETCPHYLRFAAEDVPDGATEYKCAPPIRERDNREALWRALGEGVIDLVASDHSPCPPDLKRRGSGDFLQAWGGIASLQVALPAVWTDARSRGFALSDLARWMSAAPALLAGLERKGAIAPGRDADLVAFLPEAERLVEPAKLEHRHPLTPYAGALLTGVVERTWLRGSLVYDRGVFVSPPAGRVLRRGDA
jgi:allantoinase